MAKRKLSQISHVADFDAQAKLVSGTYDRGLYFAGTINQPFRNSTQSGAFAQSLVNRFDSAVAGLDNLIIAWWDGSSDSRHGGSATIVDVCLPARPKFTLESARPTGSFGNNSVLMESYGALNACTIIKHILAHCQSKNLLRDIVGELEIILVTDCTPVLSGLDHGTSRAPRSEPMFRKIKTLSEEILGFNVASIKLDLYHCHRNMTANLKRADNLAGRARITRNKSFQCALHHEDVGTRQPGDTIYYNNWERLNDTSSGQALETELQAALQQYPMSLKMNRISSGPKTTKLKKRKISAGPKWPQVSTGGALTPIRRSARLLAKTASL